MRNVRIHLIMLFGLQALVFVTYRHALSLPLWSPVDFQTIDEARLLGVDPAVLARHVGSLFSQPLLQLAFMAEYRLFGIDPAGYMAVNVSLHGLNAFVLYLLVNMLFHRSGMAIPAAVLFAMSVGHYGKALLSIAGLEALLLGFLYLLIVFSLIRADFKHGGRMTSPWYLLGLVLVGLAGLTKPALFSILLALIAFKFFFYRERGGRAIFPRSLLLLVVVGFLFAAAKEMWGYRNPGPDEPVGFLRSVWLSFKTTFRYLNLLVFPMQDSKMLESSHPLVRFFYDWRLPIRTLVSLGIVSFSFFGIIFGSRPLRFFIAWTVITVVPFAVTNSAGHWLNLQYLYMAAAGFCVIIAAGATGCSGLLAAHRWKRLTPWIAPMLLVIMAQTLNVWLCEKNRRQGESPAVRALQSMLEYRAEQGVDDPAP